MQAGRNQRSRQVAWEALIAEGALRDTSGESASREEHVRHRSALFGMRAALPLALSLWGLIAALIWACRA